MAKLRCGYCGSTRYVHPIHPEHGGGGVCYDCQLKHRTLLFEQTPPLDERAWRKMEVEARRNRRFSLP